MTDKLQSKFDDIMSVSYPAVVSTRETPDIADEYVLVLLCHKGLLRYTYYLNLRPLEDDDIYSNRIGLFGGKIEKTSDGRARETGKAAARREILEETGLRIGEDSILLARIEGYNSSGQQSQGDLFLKIFRHSPYGIIKRHLRKENTRLAKEGEKPIGKLITVHRYRGGLHFFYKWWRLTPQAAYALNHAFERDPTD